MTGSSYGNVSSSQFSTYASNIITGFKDKITSGYTGVQSAMTTFGNYVKSCFTGIVSYNGFYQVASDVISGFTNGINALYKTCESTIKSWGASIIDWFKTKLNSNSPSKVFEQIGEDTVLGYNIGLESFGKTTKGVVNSWADSFTSVKPTMKFAVDTSALRYYTGSTFARSISADVNTAFSAADYDNGFETLIDFIIPTLGDMAGDLRRSADDMRRQADKREQTVVQVGNRVITDAVTTQEQANGYRFVRA